MLLICAVCPVCVGGPGSPCTVTVPSGSYHDLAGNPGVHTAVFEGFKLNAGGSEAPDTDVYGVLAHLNSAGDDGDGGGQAAEAARAVNVSAPAVAGLQAVAGERVMGWMGGWECWVGKAAARMVCWLWSATGSRVHGVMPRVGMSLFLSIAGGLPACTRQVEEGWSLQSAGAACCPALSEWVSPGSGCGQQHLVCATHACVPEPVGVWGKCHLPAYPVPYHV